MIPVVFVSHFNNVHDDQRQLLRKWIVELTNCVLFGANVINKRRPR